MPGRDFVDMDRNDGSAHAIPVMSALPIDLESLGEIMATNKAQNLDISIDDIGFLRVWDIRKLSCL